VSEEIAIVTGGTGALGEATVRALSQKGWTVVIACRDESRGQTVKSRIETMQPASSLEVLPLDLTSPSSIRNFVERFAEEYGRMDALIHTAAVFTSDRTVTSDGWELMFATNHLGPFLLTRLLLHIDTNSIPLRILLVTAPSTTNLNFEDLQSEQRFRALWAFGASKMCNLLFTYALARRLEGTRCTANAFHPGLIKSNLMGEAPFPMRFLTNLVSRPPDRAAAHLASLATSPKYGSVSGKFFKEEQEILSNTYSLETDNQERLWELSSSLVQLPQ
jgi:NAD(P)-dependent dehydrogenase (short-subunit alcohol dehydrogenase family)